MHRLAILICALAPSLVLLQYGIAKARVKWDDPSIWEAYFSGGFAAIVVVLPAQLLKNALTIDAMTPVHAAAMTALVIAAIPEEITKFAALFYAIKRYGRDGEPHDMITLSFAVALGFAAVENLAYLVAPGDWSLVALSRAGLPVPMHGLNGLAMGAFLTAAHLSPRRPWLLAALVIPILMHASFDFPLMLATKNKGFFGVLPAWFLVQILTTIGVLWWSNKMRAAADQAYGRPYRSSRAKLTGVAILLFVPLLALMSTLQSEGLGIATAAMLVIPSIFAIDLLRTGSGRFTEPVWRGHA
jgi:RsiW-degrading membrane proteinase PrsW (M82 family)